MEEGNQREGTELVAAIDKATSLQHCERESHAPKGAWMKRRQPGQIDLMLKKVLQ